MARSLIDILNEANPNKTDVALGEAKLGNMLRSVPQFVKGTVTSGIMTLPENARAAWIIAARVTAGTTLGPKTPAVPGATAAGIPATTLVTTSPVGHVSFNVATDAATAAEVYYLPEEGAVIEEVITVVPGTGVGTPLASRNVSRLLEATILTGTVTGVCTVDQRGFTVATTLHAAASVTGAAVNFLVADAVTSARVKYIAMPGVGNGVNPVMGTNLSAATRNY